jgi:DNA-binding protein Fis
MVVLSHGNILKADSVPINIRSGADGSSLVFNSNELDLNHNEKLLIIKALEDCDGNRTRAAEKLGINRRTLHRKLNEYDIN